MIRIEMSVKIEIDENKQYIIFNQKNLYGANTTLYGANATIVNGKGLKVRLEDGSIEEGNMIYEIAKTFKAASQSQRVKLEMILQKEAT